MLARSEQTISIKSLSDIAREAIAEANGVKADAVVALTKRIEIDPELREMIASEAIEIALQSSVGSAVRAERGQISRAVNSGREGVISLASGVMRTMLDMPLMDGTKLRDATADHLEKAVKHYRGQARQMTSMGNFLAAVLIKLPKNRVVGQVLSDAEANELWRKHNK